MSKYIVSCSSTVDLDNDFLKKLDVHYISFHYQLNNSDYKDDLGLSLSSKDFYNMMREGAQTKTSQVNVSEYIDFFTPFLENGNDILHIELSSGLSGSFNSANVAANMLKEKFPNNKIIIIDSLAASAGYGLLIDKVAELRQSGLTIDEVSNWITSNRLKLHHWFYSTDLSYYVKGGRITQTAGFVGSILHLCPLLNVNDQGKLIPRFKVIGKKRVMDRIVLQMQKHADNGLAYDGKCFISHADCLEDALIVSKKVEDAFPNLNGKVEIFNIGTTIGSHTGPGTLALYFFGDERDE
ncbi:MAG: DegV family protein [Acholeplasma sp.]|nr:DegV family protein [Acholeplasma sp.]